MEDLMQKIGQVLNDPESMKQLNELAAAFSAQSGSSPSPAPQEGQSGETPDLSALAAMLSGGQSQQGNDQSPDLSKLFLLQSVMEKAHSHDKNIDLLQALRPHLRAENQVKVDRVIKIFRAMSLYPLLKESGLLGGDLFGG